ncbi:peptidoglycan recognition protein family protein [Brachyspira hampsonii]|uniref:peptidoglycan recognition protein family protein n=1 Tax=Brachyspira hampsonii TaxID=1287055 RepID=UPI000D364309|nr:peptidoglycan recognition family protein [Brachyspira hampsonii]PTY40336.1 N-acetylmuramoyl-L-alanine amidase [Brachyspira hampsonii bv. II]
MIKNIIYIFIISLLLSSCSNTVNSNIVQTNDIVIKPDINDKYKITPNALRLKLLSEYTETHYGSKLIYLDNPQIIVVHSTETPNLSIAVNIFKNDTLIGRPDIEAGGEVNVGTHFLVDFDGTIYENTPIEYIARHTVGFNYTSISIENIGYADKLTKEQLEANVKLIKYIKSKYKSIKYIIAHYEYKDKTLPHYSLYKELNTKYINPGKRDPGTNFMKELRKRI